MIFVFGSNLAGRHGKGAALTAIKKFGAIYGQGEGRQGDSYAIPTKGYDLKGRLSLPEIQEHVNKFLQYATKSEDRFFVTRVGCGLAGYTDEEIAPMFKVAPVNCLLPEGWRSYEDSST